MKTYKITFTNCPSKIVRAANRAQAITLAVALTRGYLTKGEQRQNVVSCKLSD